MASVLSSPMTIPVDAKELRPILHNKIDSITDSDLQEVHRFLMQLEMQRLMNGIGHAVDEGYSSGRLSVETIQASIDEYRAAKS